MTRRYKPSLEVTGFEAQPVVDEAVTIVDGDGKKMAAVATVLQRAKLFRADERVELVPWVGYENRQI